MDALSLYKQALYVRTTCKRTKIALNPLPILILKKQTKTKSSSSFPGKKFSLSSVKTIIYRNMWEMKSYLSELGEPWWSAPGAVSHFANPDPAEDSIHLHASFASEYFAFLSLSLFLKFEQPYPCLSLLSLCIALVSTSHVYTQKKDTGCRVQKILWKSHKVGDMPPPPLFFSLLPAN